MKDTFIREIGDCRGKYIVTLMSSNLHRVQTLADVCREAQRKLVFVGRSIEQNVEIATQLGVLSIPKSMVVHKKHMDEYKDEELCVVVAGSQAQPGSSLVRAIYGEHPLLTVRPSDKVVFATEPIPGNETNVYEAIDELARTGIDVAYSEVDAGLHVSGHAGATEQQLLIALTKPKYLLPIGGTDRHRVEYKKLAERMGYDGGHILLPKDGVVIEFSGKSAKTAETLTLKNLMVDGLGVGDVGTIVLSDRKKMAEEGMVVVLIPSFKGKFDIEGIKVVSRGFVFHAQASEIINAIKQEAGAILSEGGDEQELKKRMERKVGKRMNDIIGRSPLILPVFLQL